VCSNSRIWPLAPISPAALVRQHYPPSAERFASAAALRAQECRPRRRWAEQNAENRSDRAVGCTRCSAAGEGFIASSHAALTALLCACKRNCLHR
jgi:hypothetical protein